MKEKGGTLVQKNTKVKPKSELLPLSYEERTIGRGGYFAMWLGISVIIATFSLGGEGVQQIKLGWVVLACLLANVVCGLFITLTSDIALEHGIPFPVYMRVPFGTIGSALPTLCRGLLGCCWFGIQTYYGATAMSYIVAYFTGFNNWYVCFLVFTALQVINTAMGIKAIEHFANFAAPCIAVISIWLFYQLSMRAQSEGIDIWNSVLAGGPGGMVTNTATVSLHVFVIVFFTNLSYWSTSSADSQSLAKFVKAPKNERRWWVRNAAAISGQMIALPITQTFCIVIGGVSMLVAGNWNPIEALRATASGAALLILLLLIVLAQWSTNISANLLPPAMTFLNIFRKYLTFPKAVIVVGIISVLTFPWELMARIGGFLNSMSAVYAPIVGITIIDYYVLRKRRLNVPELYLVNGQYTGKKGWNYAGVIAMVCGSAASLIWSEYAYGAGLITGAILYYILAKYWWYKKYPQPEFADDTDEQFLGITVGRDWIIDRIEDM